MRKSLKLHELGQLFRELWIAMLVTCLALFYAQNSLAQNLTVSGNIKSSSIQPVPGVTIYAYHQFGLSPDYLPDGTWFAGNGTQHSLKRACIESGENNQKKFALDGNRKNDEFPAM
jgi:hypothetical protein